MDSRLPKSYIAAKPMKKLLLCLLPVVVGLMMWGATGCSNREIDTVKLQGAFQSADQGIRTELDEGIADITASNYSGALVPLKHVSYAAKLTQQQRDILEDSIKKLQAKVK